METEIAGFFLRTGVLVCVVSAGLLVAICSLAGLATVRAPRFRLRR